MSQETPSIALLYHFFPPDENQSAIHFGDLSAGLASRGWHVSAYPTVWSSNDLDARFPSQGEWRGVVVNRVWRPNLRQASDLGRFLNAAWMILRWSLLALSKPHPDVLIVGTDPILSLSVALAWKLVSPKTRVVHWCFDLYPEAAIADGLLAAGGPLTRVFQAVMGAAYRRCALIADLGPCMRALLTEYSTAARRETIVPWAIQEPDGPLSMAVDERREVFGDAQLALLYSGSFGRPHSYQEILDLAAMLQPDGKLVFSVRGKRVDELKKAVLDQNAAVDFVPFASSDKLLDRIACADIHVVTLRSEWTGMVVPSKFFGALAAGRPVLFAGDEQSSLARWIREFAIGWVLTPQNIQQVCAQLLAYKSTAGLRETMQVHCYTMYQRFFSRESQVDKFDQALKTHDTRRISVRNLQFLTKCPLQV